MTDPLRYMKTERYALHDYDFEENVVMHNESFDSEESTAATASAPAVRIFQDIHELHETFSHMSFRKLQEMINRGLLKVKFRSNKAGRHCEICARTKMHRQQSPHHQSSSEKR